jgi:hypothetical protein
MMRLEGSHWSDGYCVCRSRDHLVGLVSVATQSVKVREIVESYNLGSGASFDLVSLVCSSEMVSVIMPYISPTVPLRN